MTGLSTKTAEKLQIQNYGIGGHYVPHFDQQIKSEPLLDIRKADAGNRIATVLFYVRICLSS